MKNGKTECPFCNENRQLNIIASIDLAYAIYDNFPVSKGHTLVIPYRHCSNYFELTLEEQKACWALVTEMQKKLKEKLNPGGFNAGLNVGADAGQTIEHAHIHLIPRYKGDMQDPRGGVRHCVTGKGYY